MSRRVLMLGPDTGWHANELRQASAKHGVDLQVASYESLACSVSATREMEILASGDSIIEFDGVLTRTMPAASMEKLTYRLGVLHSMEDGLLPSRPVTINSPRCLEWCIDKSATTIRLAAAGFQTPPTRFVQSRKEAMDAFAALGGDCVIKPIFGGEGKGVMRVQDPELAWYVTGTLERCDAMLQLQAFVPPGGIDLRILVVGEHSFAMRRRNAESFRTNVAAGGTVELIHPDSVLLEKARRIAEHFQLICGAIDLLETENGPCFLEVNAVPGWKGAQQVVSECIAERVIA
ncbi:MAG: ATP-grasp domain-containing protein, partial [Planctomycetota bacterium]